MEARHNLKVLWNGELPLDYIKWNERTFRESSLSYRSHSKVLENWNNHLKEYPNDYDGDLIFLDSFQFKNEYLHLNVSQIKFSTVIYMEKNRLSVKSCSPAGISHW